MSEFELWEKAVLGTGGAAGAVMLLFKMISFVKKEQVGQAGDSATMAQFKALQEQITQCQMDNKALHIEFNRMSTKIHRQQTKLTRMEVLLRQFSALVQEHGTPVPSYMQAELDDLIKPDTVTESEPMNRRSTDK